MQGFYGRYFIAAIILLGIEVLIAAFTHDAIIRPYIGDLLVVILLYCLVKSFFNTRVRATALSVLLFSYAVEILQYFHIVRILGLEKFRMARILIGTSFAWTDIWMYTLGIGLVLLIETRINKKASYI